MNLLVFCTAFIIQYVGHRIGDCFLQTEWQATNKENNRIARFRHCLVYSATIALLMLISFTWKQSMIIFGLTIIEHYWIDSRKPVITWAMYLERTLARNKEYTSDKIPRFVIGQFDQTIHYVRMFLFAILMGYEVI